MEDRMLKLLQEALKDQDQAMVPVQALYDLAGEEWLAIANEAAAGLKARVQRPERAGHFALVTRRVD